MLEHREKLMTNITLKLLILLLSTLACVGLTLIYIRTLHSRIVRYFQTKCPVILQRHIQNRRLKKIDQQIMVATDMLANCLRAGLSLGQSLEFVSENGPSPLKEDAALIVSQVKMGKDLGDALAEWKMRTPLDDVKILVEAILVLRQTGGNLVETFESIAETIRERQKVGGKIRVLTAQGVSQAVIILILPFALCIGLYLLAGWYIEPMFTTALGWVLICAALSLQTLGALWLRKIVTIRV